MPGYQIYTVVWQETHKKEVCATSKSGALFDAAITVGDAYTRIKSKDFKIVSTS